MADRIMFRSPRGSSPASLFGSESETRTLQIVVKVENSMEKILSILGSKSRVWQLVAVQCDDPLQMRKILTFLTVLIKTVELVRRLT